MAETPTELKHLDLERIDLVDQGANQEAHVTLFKRAPAKVQTRKSLTDREIESRINAAAQQKWLKDGDPDWRVCYVDRIDGDAVIQRYGKTYRVPFAISDDGTVTFDGDGREAVVTYEPLGKSRTKEPHVSNKPSVLKSLTQVFASVNKAFSKESVAGLKEAMAKIDDKESDAYKGLEKVLSDMEAAGAEMHDEPDGDEMPADKAVSKRFAEQDGQIEALRKRAESAEVIAKRLLDERDTAEVTAVLKSFSAVPFKVEDANEVALFKSLRQNNRPAFDRVVELLTAVDKQAADGLYKEIGSSAPGSVEGSAWAELERKADDEIAKSSTPLTREQALDKVMKNNPKLVLKYREEQARA